MQNRFRVRTMRNTYKGMVAAYCDRSSLLFHQGARLTINGYANSFWRGYDNIPMNWDRHSKQTPSYACYVAGRDMANLYKETDNL